ncbi:hypothetical protein O0L34_g5372 [Tuta absoluta]|nr:hypothetical protein O0L34_g5372 [Tuta absoluta]
MRTQALCICAGILYVFSARCNGEEFNLFGEAGQAYAIDINVGNPPQKLSVLVDTGSTTLAIASYPHQDNDIYFHAKNTTTIFDYGKEVQAKYSQGMWVGRLVSDLVQFPSVQNVPEVRSDIALITKSHKFFMNGSGWQGLLGLAYLPVGAWGENVIVESWLDSLDRSINKPTSFNLTLCGPQGFYNSSHAGYFKMIVDQPIQSKQLFRTTILRKRWYEVGVISIRVVQNNLYNSSHNTSIENQVTSDKTDEIVNQENCQKLNSEKSIVDSGTTNIRLPDVLFRQVVDELRNAAQASNVLILDEFWYHGEAACWPEPQDWSLPWLAIDLLNDDDDMQYFTLELPPQNYMRVVTAHNSSGNSGAVSEFCYKLGLEAGGRGTVLGYTAMEGFEVVFNRSAGWIGWSTSTCGPDAKITGPHNHTRSLLLYCQLTRPIIDTAISIRAAQWALCVVSIIAAGVLIYLLAPCVKMLLVKKMPSSPQISLSQAALVEAQE